MAAEQAAREQQMPAKHPLEHPEDWLSKAMTPTKQEKMARALTITKLDSVGEGIKEVLKENPKAFDHILVKGERIYARKYKGTFSGVPFTVMKRSKGNVLRDLQRQNVLDLKMQIGKHWYPNSPMVGTMSSKRFAQFKEWYDEKVANPNEERELPESLTGQVTTLDGQHRIAVLWDLIHEGNVQLRDARVVLTLFEDLTKEEEGIISLYTQKMMTTLKEITLVDLLKQMRDKWRDMVTKGEIEDLDQKLLLTYHFQLLAITHNTSMVELRETALQKAQERETDDNKVNVQDDARKAVSAYTSALYNKVRWAFQVPALGESFTVWPFWYEHLKSRERTGEPYTLDAYVELGGMSPWERYAVMVFAAKKHLNVLSFRGLCRFVKGQRIMLSWFKTAVAPELIDRLELSLPEGERKGPKEAVDEAEKWCAWFQSTRFASCLVLNPPRFTANPTDQAFLFDRMMDAVHAAATPTVESIKNLFCVVSCVLPGKGQAHQFIDTMAQKVKEGGKGTTALEAENKDVVSF